MEYSDQPWFVNGAARIRTSADPAELLSVLKSFEAAYGRTDGGVRFGPRPLDFDIIFYNELIMDTPRLIVPHPRMHLREFVLRPINDIAPELMHPVFCKSIRRMLTDLRTENQQCIPVEALAE
jgi:2-amino-4-hydroxy-6-hydroxymethyldihydropteridine diphosphokinase